ncbi:hypothetical protein [Acetobacter sp. AN02]|uniref:hypothetical protein n=1 Tax=Acetobacter sp. AN02 TaxID=2894186 RepID=UPI0038D1289F
MPTTTPVGTVIATSPSARSVPYNGNNNVVCDASFFSSTTYQTGNFNLMGAAPSSGTIFPTSVSGVGYRIVRASTSVIMQPYPQETMTSPSGYSSINYNSAFTLYIYTNRFLIRLTGYPLG